ncbi:DUF4097 family beta strand repeat protein [Streptomyces sp. J2-1]|uniref:DUF4097 family beta strand repeat-containing protein n=1 Tax=Streptomyces corallincola TaxID=2851888 RepID=UPI001C383432|nr:DUF4097 family beta strand repeat-containing protein [Streptomyces corallincola]MBV2353922.1 DUF4097 family beta strand repeat protein [Streptomyces corallincola]
MPAFTTPGPVSVNAQVYAGSIRFAAADRADTVVTALPRDPKRDQDVRAADQTEVSYTNGVLTVRTPKAGLFGRTGTVDVTVDLPAGSAVEVSGSWAQVVGEGPLGEVRGKTTSGDMRFETTGPLQLTVSHGSVSVERVEGAAEITSSTGNIRVGTVDGPAVLKNSHGSTSVGAVTGELRVSGANGGIDVARAESSVLGTTTHGHLRVTEVVSGTVELKTSNGSIEVGVREGVAAWLDVSSTRGQVRNTLTASGAPEQSEGSVRVHARTSWGNIDVRRARG